MNEPKGRKRSAIDLLQEVVHLREVNADLLTALELIADSSRPEAVDVAAGNLGRINVLARAAIAKAKGG